MNTPTDVYINQGVTGATALMFLTGIIYLFRENRQLARDLIAKMTEFANQINAKEQEMRIREQELNDKFTEEVKQAANENKQLREQMSAREQAYLEQVRLREAGYQNTLMGLVDSHREQLLHLQEEHQKSLNSKQDSMFRLAEAHRNEIVAIQDQAQKETAMLQEARMEDAKELAARTFASVESLTKAIDLVSSTEKSGPRKTTR